MKTISSMLRPLALIAAMLALAGLSAALNPSASLAQSPTPTPLPVVLTPTPGAAQAVSEVGSTDGIVLLGAIIVVIIIVPILWKRREWR